jgi:hypothetical protein
MSLKGHRVNITSQTSASIFRQCLNRCTSSAEICNERNIFAPCQKCKVKEYPEFFTKRDLHSVLLRLKEQGVTLRQAASIAGIPRNTFEKMSKWDSTWPDWPIYNIYDPSPRAQEMAGTKGPGEIVDGLTTGAMQRLMQAMDSVSLAKPVAIYRL